jgi:hypothetical protein
MSLQDLRGRRTSEISVTANWATAVIIATLRSQGSAKHL